VFQIRKQTEVYHNARVKKFYLKYYSKGLGVTFLKNIELGFIVPIRDHLKERWHLSPVFATFIAKIVATTFTYPLDTLRTMKRASIQRNPLKEICKKPSMAYAGYPLYLLRSVPMTVIVFTLQDFIR
jgi:hypothetical protein